MVTNNTEKKCNFTLTNKLYVHLKTVFSNGLKNYLPGTFFFPCSDNMKDQNLLDTMMRILNLTMEKIITTGIVAEDAARTIVEIITAIYSFN